jgi:hypothetical protein
VVKAFNSFENMEIQMRSFNFWHKTFFFIIFPCNYEFNNSLFYVQNKFFRTNLSINVTYNKVFKREVDRFVVRRKYYVLIKSADLS